MDRVTPLDWLMVLLVFFGGGCWLVAGLFQLNLVKLLTFNTAWLGRSFYVVVGLAAIYMVWMAIRLNRTE